MPTSWLPSLCGGRYRDLCCQRPPGPPRGRARSAHCRDPHRAGGRPRWPGRHIRSSTGAPRYPGTAVCRALGHLQRQLRASALTHAELTAPRLHDGMLLDRPLSHRLRKLSEVSADVLGMACMSHRTSMGHTSETAGVPHRRWPRHPSVATGSATSRAGTQQALPDPGAHAYPRHRDRRTGPAAVLWVTVGDTRKHKPATARTTAASMGRPRVTLWVIPQDAKQANQRGWCALMPL